MSSSELKRLPKEPLRADDRRFLQALFRKRLRGFLALGAILIILIALELGPNTQKIHDAIENPKLRWIIVGITLGLALLVFYRRVWVYRRDLKAGYRYVNHMLVIGKSARGSRGVTVDLEDLRYHRLPVDAATWERLQPGDRYPVSYAAYSGQDLTRPGQLDKPA